jgi:hypothetical protein
MGFTRCQWYYTKTQHTKIYISHKITHQAQTEHSTQRYTNNEGHLIIGFCILLRVILTVNNNTFCFATIDKVSYYVASVLTTCFGPYIRPSSGEFTKY